MQIWWMGHYLNQAPSSPAMFSFINRVAPTTKATSQGMRSPPIRYSREFLVTGIFIPTNPG